MNSFILSHTAKKLGLEVPEFETETDITKEKLREYLSKVIAKDISF